MGGFYDIADIETMSPEDRNRTLRGIPPEPKYRPASGFSEWLDRAGHAAGYALPSIAGPARVIPESIAALLQDERGSIPIKGQTLYHGTDQDFEQFAPSIGDQNLGSGVYLTDNPKYAGGYAENVWKYPNAQFPESALSGPNIRPVQTSTEKWLDVGKDAPPSKELAERLLYTAAANPNHANVLPILQSHVRQLSLSDEEAIQEMTQLYKEDIAQGLYGRKRLPSQKNMTKVAKSTSTPNELLRSIKWKLGGDQTSQLIKEAGFEGIANGYPGGKTNEYLVFDPNKIRSIWEK